MLPQSIENESRNREDAFLSDRAVASTPPIADADSPPNSLPRIMKFFLATIAVFTWSAHAEMVPLPAGGMDLVAPSARISASGGSGGSGSRIEVSGQAFREATQVRVAQATPGKGWSAQLTVPIHQGVVRKNDRLLVRYMARCVEGAPGRVAAKVQLSHPDYTQIGMSDAAKPGAEWEIINQPFIAAEDVPQGRGELTLFLGDQKQTIEIADIRVLNYGPDFDLTKLPRLRVTYEGRAADAPWRKEALARIAKTRMADYSVIVTGPDGKPLANTKVTATLHRHEFGFGTCVTRGMLTKEGSDGERYRDIVKRTCSRVVFENDLKPDSFPQDAKGFDQLEKSFAWLKANDIGVRGHYLIQEAVDGWTRARLGDPAKLRQTYMDSIRQRLEWVGDRVTEWDVINHPIAWEGAEMLGTKGPPFDTLSMDVFREARRLTQLPLCINEDQLFRPGAQQDKTFEMLEKLKRDGVRVDGLGNQAHFNSSFLPSPEELLRVTDRFTAVAPKQVITEYDVATNGDEQLAADYLRDCLIVCFSHPAYDGFLLWGFWENSHWIPEAALWRKDWSIKPIGQVWEDWVGKRWQTREELVTDAQGKITWRGYKGSYRIETGGKSSSPFQPAQGSTSMKVSVP
jgi:endo-1,4-beta-xylanase